MSAITTQAAIETSLLEGTVQTTAAGERVVTVARDGARTAGCNAIYVTAVYVAVHRQSDGLLTWRLDERVGQRTSGKKITAPMVSRAREIAESLGLPYRQGVRHGMVCG